MDQITQTLHCSNKSDLVHDSEDYPGEPIKVISTPLAELVQNLAKSYARTGISNHVLGQRDTSKY